MPDWQPHPRDLAVERVTEYLREIPLEERVPGYGAHPGLSGWDKAEILALLEDGTEENGS